MEENNQTCAQKVDKEQAKLLTPKQEIEMLNRKLTREKKARNQAELQLEKYSREIYETNQSLKENLQRINKRSLELEFLHKTSGLVNSELSITELLKSITSFTSQFIHANVGGYYVTSEYLNAEEERSRVWTQDKSWHKDSDLFTVFNHNVKLKESLDVAQWIISPLEKHSRQTSNAKWIVYKCYALDKLSSAVVAFLCNDDSLEEEMLYVLDTLNDHLSSGLKRRLADQRIQRRNNQLEDTVSRLAATQQQLIQSEKMASLGLLSAGVAHEINNPVGYIKANLEVLKDYQKDLDNYIKAINTQKLDAIALSELGKKFDIDFLLSDSKDIIATNLEGIQRVSDIINGLKTYSHAGDNEQSLMSIKTCIDQALKVAGNELKYQHEVENAVPENLPEIVGNSGQFATGFCQSFC